MAKILGIDVGTNSLGWAVIDHQKGKILTLGSRIFPEGVNIDKGREVSRNVKRRMSRMGRRKYFRYKLRRKKLLRLLNEKFGVSPDKNYYTFEKKPSSEKKCLWEQDSAEEKVLITSKKLYFLRKKALEEQISLSELGRIFLHLNRRRGFLSTKLDESGSDKKKKDETGKVKSGIKTLKNEIEECVKSGNIKIGTLGEYFYWLISQHPDAPNIRIRGRYTERQMYEFEFDKIWDFQRQFYPSILTDENYSEIKEKCIFFQRNLRSQKHLRSRCLYEFRTFYKNGKECRNYLQCALKSSFEFQEFRIWQSVNNLRYIEKGDVFELTQEQKEILAAKLDSVEEFSKTEIKKTLNFGNKITFKGERKEDELKDKMKGNTTKSQIINALGEEFLRKFSDSERSKILIDIWHYLVFASHFPNGDSWLRCETAKSLKRQNYAAKIGLNETQLKNLAEINLEPDFCSLSSKAIKKLLPHLKKGKHLRQAEVEAKYVKNDDSENKKVQYSLSEIKPLRNNELRNPIVQQSINETLRQIRHLSRTFGQFEEIHIELARELKKNKKERERIRSGQNKTFFQRQDYITFLKKQGISPTKENILKFELFLELRCTEEIEKKKSSTKKEEKTEEKKDSKKKTPEEIQSELFELWKKSRILPYENMEISLHDIFNSYIEVEHIVPKSQSLDDSFQNKTLVTSEFNAKKSNKTPFEYFSKTEFEKFKKRVSHFSDEKQKLFLMKTADELTDFKNNQLNDTAYIARKLSEYLRMYFPNKIILTKGGVTKQIRQELHLDSLIKPEIFTKIRDAKNKIKFSKSVHPKNVDFESLKYDGLDKKNIGNCWAIFNEKGKFQSFIRREENDEFCENLQTNNFAVAGEIVFHEGKQIGYKFYSKKNRSDHRHHAIDALVIALTTQALIKKLSDESANHNSRKTLFETIKRDILQKFPNIKDDAKNWIKTLLISYRNKNIAVTFQRKKLYLPNGKVNIKKGKMMLSGGVSARGELHEESFYGQIKNPYEHQESNYVIRKPLESIDNKAKVEKIVDKPIRDLVKNYLRFELGVNINSVKYEVPKKAFFNEDGTTRILLKNQHGKEIPVNKVRWVNNSKSLYPIRKGKTFVETGNNFIIAIYGSEVLEKKEKREFEVVSFIKAAEITKRNKGKKDKELLFPREKKGKKLLTYLQKKDLVVVYQNHPDEIEWENQKFLFKRLFFVIQFDVNGNIILGRHNLQIDKADSANRENLDNFLGSVIDCNENSFKGIKVYFDKNGKLLRCGKNIIPQKKDNLLF